MHIADSELARLTNRDLARIVRRMMKSGMTTEDVKEYFVTAIPKVLVHVSEKQPKAGYKLS